MDQDWRGKKSLKPSEVAEIMGVDRRKVYRWIDDGYLVVFRMEDKKRTITPESVIAMMGEKEKIDV